MTVLSFNINYPGQAGVFPNEISIQTNNTLDEVMAVGYLDHMFAENVPIENGMMALVSTKPAPNSPVTNTVSLQITFASGRWSLKPSLINPMKVATTAAYAGGGTSHAFAATGLTSSSIVTANILTSTNSVSITKVVPSANTLTITFSADPGAGTTVNYIAFSGTV